MKALLLQAFPNQFKLARSKLGFRSMNPTHTISAPATAGQKLTLPVWIFETSNEVVPVHSSDRFETQDQLRDDLGIAEGARHVQRPMQWSALNDF